MSVSNEKLAQLSSSSEAEDGGRQCQHCAVLPAEASAGSSGEQEDWGPRLPCTPALGGGEAEGPVVLERL